MPAPRRLLTRALDALTLNRGDAIAPALRVSASALRRYRDGSRTPPPAFLRNLAKLLRRQSDRLAALAHDLEEAAHATTTKRRPSRQRRPHAR